MTPIRLCWQELPAHEAWPDPCPEAGEEIFGWELPERGEVVLALGAVAELMGHGAGRFEEARLARTAVEAGLRVDGCPDAGAPRWVGGFAFDGEPRDEGEVEGALPPLRFVLPRVLWWRRQGRVFRVEASGGDPSLGRVPAPARAPCEVRRSLRIEAGAPLVEDQARFREALARVRDGSLQKLVVARRLEVRLGAHVDLRRARARLRRAHPSSHHYRLVRGARAFLGASPERLLRVVGGQVEADALAGSAPRGCSPQVDAALRRSLVESKKEQEEHAFVVRHLCERLAPLCDEVWAPEAPRVRATEGIQHLHTPVRARSRGADLLTLAERLHPTPAVAGTPCEAAQAWLREHEGFDRGWYAGGVGWLDGAGGGDIAVALRCALLHGHRGSLYAGAGVVAGSDPEAEIAETRLKMRALLDPWLEL